MPIKKTYGKKVYRAKRSRKFGSRSPNVRYPGTSFNTQTGKVNKGYSRGGSARVYGNIFADRAFPSVMYMQHKFVSVHTLQVENITGSIGPTQQYRLNSMYDPDSTGAGHQPSGFDQMAAIYMKYNVYKTHVKLRILNATDSTCCLVVMTKPTGGSYSITSSTPDIACEASNCIVIDGQKENPSTWEQTFNIGQIEGVPNTGVTGDISYSAAINTNPSLVPTLNLACGNWNAVVNTSIRVAVELTFYARWFNNIAFAQS